MNKGKNIFSALMIVLCLAGLSSCATAKPIIGPHGKKGYVIECDQTHECYEKAVEMCKGGEYELMHGGAAKDSASGVSVGPGGYVTVHSSYGSLVINCK